MLRNYTKSYLLKSHVKKKNVPRIFLYRFVHLFSQELVFGVSYVQVPFLTYWGCVQVSHQIKECVNDSLYRLKHHFPLKLAFGSSVKTG